MRTGADDGLVAEMLKTGHQGLMEVMAAFFTEILNGTVDLPENWKLTKLKLTNLQKVTLSYRRTIAQFPSYQ